MSRREFLSLKQFYQSKTVILNTIVTILAVWDQVAPFVPKEWAPRAAAVVGILNILLRVFSTSTKISTVARMPDDERGD